MRWLWQRQVDEGDIVRSAASDRDDRVSAYLDGLLEGRDRTAVESDIAADEDLRVAVEGMRAVRAGLGGLGLKRAPRSFALEPRFAPQSYGLPRIELYARAGAVAAALVLSVTALAPQLTTGGVGQQAVATNAESRQASGVLQDSAPAADAGQALEAQKQAEAPSGARSAAPVAPAAPVTENAAPVVAPAAAPATGGAGAAAPQAPAAAPKPPPAATAASAPRVPEAFGATSKPATASPGSAPAASAPVKSAAEAPTALPPVELSRRERLGALSAVQIGLAVVALSLGVAALVLMLRRRAATS